MGGVDLVDGTLVVDRAPNALDELAIDCSAILSSLDIEHAFVAGYVAILAGRPRATDDIDMIMSPESEQRIDQLVRAFREQDFWGPAAPLDQMYENLSHDANIWIARAGEQAPHLDATYPSNSYDRASLSGSIQATIGDEGIPIGPLELQIAYKLYLGSRTDVEDAAHLYTLFGEELTQTRLEYWVAKLGVTTEFNQLQ